MTNTLFFWATIIITALLIETGAPGLFYFLSLAIGSAVAACLSYYGFDLVTQSAWCFAISCAMLLVLRYLVKYDSSKELPTNTHALIGQKARILDAITPDKAGTIKVYGDIWLAREKHNNEVPSGYEVTILDVQGCHVIVKK
ncbi:MAG: NfeD family protein [Candidatus Babeliaceae bacterium]|nr:NfeD family protein [Candidatus Babeliaceae bacterium]